MQAKSTGRKRQLPQTQFQPIAPLPSGGQQMQMALLTTTAVWLNVACAANAYPEFQEYAEKNSGRTTNCATCHENAAGPSGKAPGQIGSLKSDEMEKLNQARGALEPGVELDSPILNKFGDSIMKKLGKKKVLAARANPAALATDYGQENDIDGDGVADAQEYLDGADPLNKFHADAARIFLVNLGRHAPHLIAAAIGVFLLDWGFARMITGFLALKQARHIARSRALLQTPDKPGAH